MMWPKESSHTATNKFLKKHDNLFDLCLTGTFLALIIIVRLICVSMGPFILGYGLQLHYVPYGMGLIAIRNWKYKLIFFLLAPSIIIIFSAGVNPLLDYVLTMYSFFSLMFFTMIKNKTTKTFTTLFTLIFLSFCLANWWNIVSGVVFYRTTWKYSFVFNTIFNSVNFVIIAPVMLFCYKIFILGKQQLVYELTY